MFITMGTYFSLHATESSSEQLMQLLPNLSLSTYRKTLFGSVFFYPDCIENSKSYGGGGLYLQSINQVTLGYDVVFNNVPENTNASESYFASAGLSIFNQDEQVSFSLSSQNYIGCVCLTFLHCAF